MAVSDYSTTFTVIFNFDSSELLFISRIVGVICRKNGVNGFDLYLI